MRNQGQFRRKKKNLKPEFALPDSDAQFAFIAGYTEGGFPYGTTRDELLEDTVGGADQAWYYWQEAGKHWENVPEAIEFVRKYIKKRA
ncbi:hypothetical protein [Geobacter argillaceus]|uniref:Uncharacterized protein n=1 Tax=Geobacter argillaceus TaxID=345631 RepID=A0A562VI34_9BACT|nr:hypothetical protein [Geobacter argillaceus]TWJ17613.1 hypothetical protein JN12_03008 [Geobacter argillaceus]